MLYYKKELKTYMEELPKCLPEQKQEQKKLIMETKRVIKHILSELN